MQRNGAVLLYKKESEHKPEIYKESAEPINYRLLNCRK